MQLSKKKLDGLKVWDDMTAWAENKTTVEGTITEENKGRFGRQCQGYPGVHPTSQSGIAKLAHDMAGMVGKTVQLKITEVNRAPPPCYRLHPRRQLRGSQGRAQEDLVRDQRVGKQYHGTVKSLTLRRVRGHRRCGRHGSRFELSWNRIKTR